MSRQRLRQSQRTQKGRSRIRRTPQRSRLRRRILCIRGKVPRRTVRSDSHRRSSGQRNRQKHPPETPRRSRQILQRNLRNHRREQNRRRSTRSAQIINIFFSGEFSKKEKQPEHIRGVSRQNISHTRIPVASPLRTPHSRRLCIRHLLTHPFPQTKRKSR